MALTITIGDEYKIKIEKEEEFKESIFSGIYKEASRNVEAIISQSISAEQSGHQKSTISDDSYNNIIAFTGERGTGKSSSMISFAEGLINKNENSSFFKEKNYPNIFRKSIVSIDVIDPSLFRGDDQLFEIIISKMFARFQEKLKNDKEEINHDQKRKLIEKFQHVFNNLKVVHKGKKEVYDKEAIEALSDLAYGSNLKLSFKLLVDEYLKYVGKNSRFLLVAIDDFDLNISGSYEMLEDIRQFLIQSNIIILVACKAEQLQDSINNEIIKEYQFTLSNNMTQEVGLSEQIRDKSFRYLEKLIPSSHQLVLPKLTTYSPESNFKLTDGSNVIVESSNLEDWLLEFIYKETQIFISKRHLEINSLMPKTLRELSNLITKIYLSTNKLVSFKDYIISRVANDLPQDKIISIERLENQGGKSLIYFMLHTLGGLKMEFGEKIQKDCNYLFFPKKIQNVSLGDVYAVFKMFDEDISPIKSNLKHYLNLLKIYFSIRIKEHEVDDQYDDSKLCEGGYFNPYFDIFRTDKKTGERRDWIEIHVDNLENFRDNIDLFYWVNFFISSYGKNKLDYRDESEPHFLKPLTSKGGQYTYAQFSFLTPLSQVMFYTEIIDQITNEQDEFIESSELFMEVLDWAEHNKLQPLLNNVFFFNEFIEKLDSLSQSYRDSKLENYENTLWIYLIEIGEKVFEELCTKYTHLPFTKDILKEHPIYKFWNDYRIEYNLTEKINSLFTLPSQEKKKYDQAFYDEISEITNDIISGFQDGEIQILKYKSDFCLSYYSSRYFDNNNYSHQGAKQAMNNLANEFGDYQIIYQKLRNYRGLMDVDMEMGLKKIEYFLKFIVNG